MRNPTFICLLFCFFAGSLAAQQDSSNGPYTTSSTIVHFRGAPNGVCYAYQMAETDPTGQLYNCINGAWSAVAGSGGSPTGAASGDLGGNFPGPTVTVTHLAAPLPIVQGGTGTTTPAIAAGSNVSVSGSWPNQTVNATGSVTHSVGAMTAPCVTVGNGAADLKCATTVANFPVLTSLPGTCNDGDVIWYHYTPASGNPVVTLMGCIGQGTNAWAPIGGSGTVGQQPGSLSVLNVGLFAGADAGAQIASCITYALANAAGGICDATSLSGGQTIASNLVIPASIYVKLACNTNYTVSAGITVRDNAGIMGCSGAQAGTGTVLKMANASNTTILTASSTVVGNSLHGTIIMDLNFDGNKANNTGTATPCLVIKYPGETGSKIQNLVTRNCNGDGMYFTGYGATVVGFSELTSTGNNGYGFNLDSAGVSPHSDGQTYNFRNISGDNNASGFFRDNATSSQTLKVDGAKVEVNVTSTNDPVFLFTPESSTTPVAILTNISVLGNIGSPVDFIKITAAGQRVLVEGAELFGFTNCINDTVASVVIPFAVCDKKPYFSYSQDGNGPVFLGGYDMYKVAVPGNPASGIIRPYANTTNGNLRCLTSTGTNCLPYPDVKVIPAANCVNAVAGSGWSSTSTGMPAACRAGSNNFNGVLQPIPSTGGTAYLDYELPADWDTTVKPYVSVYYGSGANTSGTVIWTVSTACTKQDGSVSDDPAWIAESAMGTQTMAVANRMWGQNAQLAGAMTNCVAGSTMYIKLVLSGTASSAINVSKLVITTPRLPVIQAN